VAPNKEEFIEQLNYMMNKLDPVVPDQRQYI